MYRVWMLRHCDTIVSTRKGISLSFSKDKTLHMYWSSRKSYRCHRPNLLKLLFCLPIPIINGPWVQLINYHYLVIQNFVLSSITKDDMGAIWTVESKLSTFKSSHWLQKVKHTSMFKFYQSRNTADLTDLQAAGYRTFTSLPQSLVSIVGMIQVRKQISA